MQIEAQQLLEQLTEDTKQFIHKAQEWQQLPLATLNWKQTPQKWSVLECLEHLNLYGDFYIPEFKKQIKNSRHPARQLFKSGWFGNYCAKSMLPDKGMSMRTFKDKDPNGSQLDLSCLQRFVEQQQQMIQLFEDAATVDLAKTKTALTLPLLKMRLGDTFRFITNHSKRHMAQAQRAIAAQKD